MSKGLKINDKVKVISGKHKGKEAKIVGIDRANGKACLDGIGLVERHMKKTQFNPAGCNKTVHLGINCSNLKLVEAAKYDKEAAKKAEKKADKKKNAKKGAK